MTYRIPDLPKEYEVKIVCDSVSKAGARLTTFVCTYPHIIHSQVMTHRMLSKNISSSRAVPTEKIVGSVIRSPAMPVYWGANKKGMQADEEVPQDVIEKARVALLGLRDHCADVSRRTRIA